VTADAAKTNMSILLDTAGDIKTTDTLIIDPSGNDRESVQITAVHKAVATEGIFSIASAGDNFVLVKDATKFILNANVYVKANDSISYFTVQGITDRSNTATKLTNAVAAGTQEFVLDSVANFKIGDRIVVFDAFTTDVGTITDIKAGTRTIKIDTAGSTATHTGLKFAYDKGANVRALSSVTLDRNLGRSIPIGSIVSTFASVDLTAGLKNDHARDTKILITRTTAGNSDFTARLFSVNTTTGAATPIVGIGASAGGLNGLTPSAPHGDSRSMNFVVVGSSTYLIETDDGGIYRLQLTVPDGAGSKALTAVERKWQSMNGNLTASLAGPNALALTEIGSIAYDTLNDIYFLGAQDIGSQQQGAAGDLQFQSIAVGDGNTQGVGIEMLSGTTAARIKEFLEADVATSGLFAISLPLDTAKFNSGIGLVPAGTTATLTGGADAVQSSLAYSFSDDNNDLRFTINAATAVGKAGDGIKIQFLNNAGPAADSVAWDLPTRTITFTVTPNSTSASDLVALAAGTPAVAAVVDVSLTPKDGGKPNTGAGTFKAADLGKPARTTINGKDAIAAAATIVVPGLNNNMRISAKTAGVVFNGVIVSFTNPNPNPGPGAETVVYDVVANTLVFSIAPQPTNKFVTWRYSLGNNWSSLTRSEYDDTGANITGNPDGKIFDLLAAPATPDNFKSGLLADDKNITGFVTIPMAINAVDPTRLVMGYFGLYESRDRGNTISVVPPKTSGLNKLPLVLGMDAQGEATRAPVSAIAYGGKNSDGTANPDVIYSRLADDRALCRRALPRRCRGEGVRAQSHGVGALSRRHRRRRRRARPRTSAGLRVTELSPSPPPRPLG